MMSSPAVYEPFDRVWVKMDGYDWWPARIVSDEELDASKQSRPEGFDITVYFYEGTTTPASLEHFHTATANITFFETSSAKAVTNDDDLLAAIRRAEVDEMANPLKHEVSGTERVGAGKSAGDSGATAAASTSSRRAVAADAAGAAAKKMTNKRARSVDSADKASLSEENSLKGANFLPDNRLIAIAERIQSAVDANDLASLRIELCDLDTVSVTVRQLETTRVGVAVGSILGKRELQKLRPLALALISSWARAMPAETIDAIKRHQRYRIDRSQDAAAKANASEDSLLSPLNPNSSSLAAITVSSPVEPTAENKEKARTRFVDRVRKLLDNPTDPQIPNVTSDDFDKVAEELCRDIIDAEDRKHLQEVLEKPGMTQLRRDLATGVLSGSDFLKLPRSALMTENEKHMEESRITRIIEEQEKVKLANLAITSLFKCPSCSKNNCSFYEQQTRSADEPTTKFITCLECKHAWTTE